MNYFAHDTAIIDKPCTIGANTKIWHFSHICEGAVIGESCSMGQNVFIAGGVNIGNYVKIQNNVSLYAGIKIEDDVFLGPSCVVTNVSNPRAQVNRQCLYESTHIKRGATIGANATLVCGITLGRYAFVAAGAVVTHDAPDYALIMGVPGKQYGWMSRHGHKLENPDKEGIMWCPESGYRYKLTSETQLKCLDLDENTPLPKAYAKGSVDYRQFKSRSKPQ